MQAPGRARLRKAMKYACAVLGLRGLGALAPAMMLVGLLPRLRYLKAFGARGNFGCAQFRKSSGLSKIRRDGPFLQQVVRCNYE